MTAIGGGYTGMTIAACGTADPWFGGNGLWNHGPVLRYEPPPLLPMLPEGWFDLAAYLFVMRLSRRPRHYRAPVAYVLFLRPGVQAPRPKARDPPG